MATPAAIQKKNAAALNGMRESLVTLGAESVTICEILLRIEDRLDLIETKLEEALKPNKPSIPVKATAVKSKEPKDAS